MIAKFTYNDVVQLVKDCNGRPIHERAWIVGVFEMRPKGAYFDKFPTGAVYSIEFEDGSSIEVHESVLRAYEPTRSG